jgi:hypothetical protein
MKPPDFEFRVSGFGFLGSGFRVRVETVQYFYNEPLEAARCPTPRPESRIPNPTPETLGPKP